jgi:hypothetical protein
LHIVFIVGSYFPYYSAVGKCVGNVAEELAKKHKITIICQKNFGEQEDIELYNNQKIIRVDTNENKLRNKLNRNISKKKGIQKSFNKTFLNYYKSYLLVKTILSKITIKKKLVSVYSEALNNISDPIDMVIPASMPYESVIAAINYKLHSNGNPKIIPYLFDHFSENLTLHRHSINRKIKRRRHLHVEKRMLKEVDALLVMNHLKNHFTSRFPDYSEKVNSVEHPLLKNLNKEVKNNDSNQINIVYTGSFYKKIRNPDYFLMISELSLNDIRAVFKIYSFGNCGEIVESYAKRHRQIVDNGSVSTDEAYSAMNNGDILVAIGNIDNTQVPSKIFEYLSVGKPIVYFYSTEDDWNLEILEKYPLSLCLKQDLAITQENVQKFNEFCIKNSNNRIDYKKVEELYFNATPEHSANLIIKLANV